MILVVAALAFLFPGSVKITGTGYEGYLMVWSGHNSGYASCAINKAYSYSNTATTVTVNGITYNAVYGSVKSGIAQVVKSPALTTSDA